MREFKIERLSDNIQLKQYTDGYCFSSDAINLFNFINIKNGLRIVDLGCNSGVLSLLIADKFKPKSVVGVEIQESFYDLFLENIELNGLGDVVSGLNCDMAESVQSIGSGWADVVVCNPPYFEVCESRINDSEEIAICRHEIKASLDDVVSVSKKILKYGGKLYICYPAGKIQRLCHCLGNNNFAIKRMRILTPKGTENYPMAAKKDAYLTIVEATLGGKTGAKIECV